MALVSGASGTIPPCAKLTPRRRHHAPLRFVPRPLSPDTTDFLLDRLEQDAIHAIREAHASLEPLALL